MAWLILVVLLAMSAAVSGSETALFSVGRGVLAEFRRSKNPLKRRTARLMERPRRVLLTLLLANVVINTSIFALAFIAAERAGELHPVLRPIASVALLFSVIIFGDMLSKAVALANANRWAPFAGALASLLEIVVGPVVAVLSAAVVDPITRLLAPARPASDSLTREELEALLQQSARDGIIDSRENEMLLGAVALGDTSVREVMTPRVDLQSIPASSDPETAREIAKSARRRSLLVHGANLDDIRGVVLARDLWLKPHAPLHTLVRPVHYVPEQINLVQLTRHFRERRIESAVVVDEYGGTAGVVSLVDVAKRIVGDVPDDGLSRSVDVEELDDNTYRVPGDLSVRLWASRFGVHEIDPHIDTVAGLVLSRLGRVPRPGDAVSIGNVKLLVETIRRRRIATVLLKREAGQAAKQEITA